MQHISEKKSFRKIEILYPFSNSSYQNFMQGFADSLIDNGFKKREPYQIPWKIRLFIAKLKLCRNFSFLTSSKKHLIVCGGGYIDSFAFPYAYNTNIIPVLWDTWPRYWSRLINSFKRNNIRLAFFTQKQVAEYVTSKIPGIKCVHLPEGLEQNGYSKGLSLKERNIDLLEMGRLYPKLHFELLRIQDLSLIHLYQKGPELLFPTFEDLSKALSDTKISFCFPRCDTHIEHAGSVETLTQRYWECMYSRTLILGRAPKELVDLLGYNPVIDINWDNVGLQILGILGNIEKYQPLVDRNYEYAVEFATWKSRIPFIEEVLSKYLDDEKK